MRSTASSARATALMPDPKKPPVRVRFIAADGTTWTVWDATWSKGKFHPRPHGDPTATKRIFVNKERVRRPYTFKPGESRVLEEQALERQLGAAGYLPSGPPHV
jgi:hypothetical protein